MESLREIHSRFAEFGTNPLKREHGVCTKAEVNGLLLKGVGKFASAQLGSSY